MNDMQKRLFNVHQAAAYTGLAVGTLYNLVSRREIRFVKLGRKLLFDHKDLDAWIESCKVEPLRIHDYSPLTA